MHPVSFGTMLSSYRLLRARQPRLWLCSTTRTWSRIATLSKVYGQALSGEFRDIA